MAVVNISKRSVDALKPKETIFDDKLSGFCCRCQTDGKFYGLKYKLNGAQHWYTIGKHDDSLTAVQARKEAEVLKSQVRQGIDIVASKQNKAKEQTISQLADRYFSEHVQRRNKPSTQAEIKRIIKNVIKPAFGDWKISNVTTADIRKWHQDMMPYEGNRVLAYFSKMMSLAATDYDLIKQNPCIGVKKHKEKPRERSFSDEEMKRISKALNAASKSSEFDQGCIKAIWLLAHTGCRLGEILSLKWDEVDLINKCLNLSDTKTGSRTVSLGDETVALLEEFSRKGIYVLKSNQPLKNGYRRFWEWIKKEAKLPSDARLHDFRHTAATYGAQADHNAFALRDYMGHKTVAMTNRYVDRAKNPALAVANSVSSRVASSMQKPVIAAPKKKPKKAK